MNCTNDHAKKTSEHLAGTPYQHDYEVFRSELFELSAAFDEAGASFPPLLHQWVWGDEDMRPGDWQAFIRANSRRETPCTSSPSHFAEDS